VVVKFQHSHYSLIHTLVRSTMQICNVNNWRTPSTGGHK